MGKVYATSDWHGCWNIAEKILNFLQPDDVLYFLGDFADRGEDGIKIIQALMHRPNTKFVIGNHDEFILQNFETIENNTPDDGGFFEWGDAFNLFGNWIMNGGQSTYDAISKLPKEERYEIYSFLRDMPDHLYYDSPNGYTVMLEHAGYSPFIIPHRTHYPTWDRDHFYDDWCAWGDRVREIREDGKEITAKNTYIVHGHTPVQLLLKDGAKDLPPISREKFKEYDKALIKPEVVRYCNNHKFDVDMCTIVSKRIALLDLDTFEAIYFDEEN